jgi:hypothetical protein
MLAEATTTEISKENNPKNFADNKKLLERRWNCWNNWKQIEEQTGKKIVSPQNAKVLKEYSNKLKE